MDQPKIPAEELTFSVLDDRVDLSSFSCHSRVEEKDLEDFLKQDALDNQRWHFSVTYVVHWLDHLVGYFTLVTDCIEKEELAKGHRDKHFHYRYYPAIKIARLAVHDDYRHRDIGTNIIIEVLHRIADVSYIIGCRIVTVDSKPSAEGFYEDADFQHALINPADPPKDTVPFYYDILPVILEREKLSK